MGSSGYYGLVSHKAARGNLSCSIWSDCSAARNSLAPDIIINLTTPNGFLSTVPFWGGIIASILLYEALIVNIKFRVQYILIFIFSEDWSWITLDDCEMIFIYRTDRTFSSSESSNHLSLTWGKGVMLKTTMQAVESKPRTLFESLGSECKLQRQWPGR